MSAVYGNVPGVHRDCSGPIELVLFPGKLCYKYHDHWWTSIWAVPKGLQKLEWNYQAATPHGYCISSASGSNDNCNFQRIRQNHYIMLIVNWGQASIINFKWFA